MSVAVGRSELFAVLDFAITALPINYPWQQHEVEFPGRVRVEI